MEFHLEFAKSRSDAFDWALRLCRKWPSFREYEVDGMKLYSVDFTDKELKAVQPILSTVCGWKKASIYVDGELRPMYPVMEMVWELISNEEQGLKVLRKKGYSANRVIDAEIVNETFQTEENKALPPPSINRRKGH